MTNIIEKSNKTTTNMVTDTSESASAIVDFVYFVIRLNHEKPIIEIRGMALRIEDSCLIHYHT